MRQSISSVGDGTGVAGQRIVFVSTETWTTAILLAERIDMPTEIRRCLASCCSSDSVPWSMAPQAHRNSWGDHPSPPPTKKKAANPSAPPSAVTHSYHSQDPPSCRCEVVVKAVAPLGLLFGETA